MHPPPPPLELPTKPMRRHDVDWLRGILFGLLIWFHYAVFSLDALEGEDSNTELFNLPLFLIIAVMHQWRLAALFGIKGGKEEVNKLYPYATTEEKGIRFVISLVFNALAVGMILMLLVWIIGADVLSA